MTGLESILDGIVTYLVAELKALEDTDSVTGTAIPLFQEVGRGQIDKVTKYPGAYIWLDYGDPAELELNRVTHYIHYVIRIFAEEASPQDLMDKLIMLVGKIYDKALESSNARSMGGTVQRRSPGRYLLFPKGFSGTVTNAADIRFEIEKKFRVE